ncbi:MAG: hypothetical protein M1832_005521 [Thelocarpon impressellum]|nr:MAG: hypothetical protein M1832_005521 [Thelocarpon impressellum]
MANPQPPFPIPLRTSSRDALAEARIRHKTSMAELKRKLSGDVKEGTVQHQKLRIQEVELDRDMANIELDFVDLQREEGVFDVKDHKKAQKMISIRVISLGDELWKRNKELRDCLERENQIVPLTPDSDGAFVETLLHLYKDPTTKNRSSTAQSNMRRDSIEIYNALPARAGEAPHKNWLWCSVTAAFYDPSIVVAAHILPAAIKFGVASYLFGAGAAGRIFSTDNCLIMMKTIEAAFDAGSFVILPVDPMERPIRRWKTVVVDPAAMNTGFTTPSGNRTMRDLDGKELVFRSEHRPASRFLYYHFVMTLLRARQLERPGWEVFWNRFKQTTPFPTMGRYLRDTMLLTLAKRTGGDLTSEELRFFIGERGVKVERGLTPEDESEIARQNFEVRYGSRGVTDPDSESDADKEDEGKAQATDKDGKGKGKATDIEDKSKSKARDKGNGKAKEEMSKGSSPDESKAKAKEDTSKGKDVGKYNETGRRKGWNKGKGKGK